LAVLSRRASSSVFEVERFTDKFTFLLLGYAEHIGQDTPGDLEVEVAPPPPLPVALCEEFDSKYVSCLLLVARYAEIQL